MNAPRESYRDVVDNAWDRNVLMVVLLELTYACNLDCLFCYNDRSIQGTRLSLDEYRRLFDELAQMSVLSVVLSGGEPMVHPDFWAIGAAARERGFVVRMKTNGLLLRGDAIARLQREVDPFVVEVSLHGATAETHDALTQVPGSFVRLRANLREMKSAGLRVRINSTLTRLNERELDGMFAIAAELDLPLTVDPDVTPRDDGDRGPLDLAASDDGLRALWERSVAASATPVHHEACGTKSDKHCGAGSSTLCIDPVGNVYPCVQWRRAAGNVRDGALASLWSRSRVLHEIRAATVDVKRMIDAQPGGAFMGFCPGTADSLGAGPLAPYDAARRRAEAAALVVDGKLRVLR